MDSFLLCCAKTWARKACPEVQLLNVHRLLKYLKDFQFFCKDPSSLVPILNQVIPVPARSSLAQRQEVAHGDLWNVKTFAYPFPDEAELQLQSKLWSERENQQDATVRCLFSTISQHVSGIILPIFRRTRRMLLHVVCCAGSAGCGALRCGVWR